MRGFSWEGPWKLRRGLDMEALSTTGFTVVEGAGGLPTFPPTLVMNDYISGYLGAAGVIAALRRRVAEGGSWHVHVNLARAAMWFLSLGMIDDLGFTPDADQRMIEPRTVRFASPYGEVHRLAPQVQLSKTPGAWQEPLLTVRGSDLPKWKA